MNTTDWSMDIVPRGEEDGRVFTLEQANRSLILLQRIVGEVVREYGDLMELEERIESAEQTSQPHQLEQARQQLVTTVDNLQTCLEELDQIGVELRDFARGIVDFPCLHEDRLISLCWLFGEEEVTHWHERHAGFACRQPIELLQYHAETETVEAHSAL
ncbi:MAG: DUF2203 domain-containing protein [Phycisphaerae bacterium]|nr:DUF2203 domain-containing protein [Phycisphaerae bacterium]